MKKDIKSKSNKVFCIGLSRTGTTSLSNILSDLGYNVIHYPLQLFISPELIDIKYKFDRTNKILKFQERKLNKQIEKILKNSNYKNIFQKYNAFSDLPIPLYYKDLFYKFPNSKFIYTYREEESWIKSIEWNIKVGFKYWNLGFLEEELMLQTYGTIKFDKKKLLSVYRHHHKSVSNFFSNKNYKFLSINIDKNEMSYERICKFLNLPIKNVKIKKENQQKKINLGHKIKYLLYRNVPYVFYY